MTTNTTPSLERLALRTVAVAGGSLSLQDIINVTLPHRTKGRAAVGVAVLDCVLQGTLICRNNSRYMLEQIFDLTDRGRARLAELEGAK
ncbi:hypothetical protein IAD21_00921 [Abditibacteriota bacterium]|nr:hypothetical protein IAD21_00921 [Abditibacteriota bacterium]